MMRFAMTVFWMTFAAPCALGLPEYVEAFRAKYGSGLINRYPAGQACFICHDQGTPPSFAEFDMDDRNCYKRDLHNLLVQQGVSSIATRLDMLDGVDSDGDGVPNGAEITCNVIFLPGIPPNGIFYGGYNPGLVGSPGRDPCDNNHQWSKNAETPPDSDGDGIRDCVDQCPFDPLKTAPGQCGCGRADTDSDGDGVADCHDMCPGVPDDANSNGTPDCQEATLVLTVNSTADSVDANPGDHVCADAMGRCTLRAAIMEANATPGTDTILVPAGTYLLTIPNTSESSQVSSGDASQGDLDIDSSMTILGADPRTTILDGSGMGGTARVFQTTFNAGNVVLANLTIRGGHATGVVGQFGSGYGGGILNNVPLTVTNCIITGNSVTGDLPLGGGIYNGGTLTLTHSLITGNTLQSTGTAGHGAGFCNDFTNGATANITNCTFSANMALSAGDGGGGVAIDRGGTVTLTNCTIAANSAPTGGGLYLPAGTMGTFTLRNTILSGNSGGDVMRAGGTLTSNGHNLVGDNSFALNGPGDMNGVDPKLTPLQDNGGPSLTHALQFGSPAIDAGENAGAPSTDQRGFRRPVNGTALASAVVDIGAVEYDDCNGNHADDGRDIATHLSADCNTNGVPDACEAGGQDCNTNGILDGCEGLADADTDGVADPCDTCPNANDLVDLDGDGVPDCKDGCPADPAKTAPGTCGCGRPDHPGCGEADDADGDGIADSVDNCPAAANHDQKDSDGDGKGDVCDDEPTGLPPPGDMDNDGVLDAVDNCPTIANFAQTDSDGNGIGDACDSPTPPSSSPCGLGCGGGAGSLMPLMILGWGRMRRRSRVAP